MVVKSVTVNVTVKNYLKSKNLYTLISIKTVICINISSKNMLEKIKKNTSFVCVEYHVFHDFTCQEIKKAYQNKDTSRLKILAKAIRKREIKIN